MEATPTADPARAEARLLRWMTACAVVGTLATLAGGQARVSAGFALGAAFALLNYHWLHQAIETLLSAGQARLPKGLVLKMLIRYPLVFGVIYFLYRTGWLPLLAVLAGLFVPVGGILIEAVIQIRQGLRENGQLTTDH